jgi:hypothetical protein
MASFACKTNAPSSASAAEDMTTFMIVAFVKMAPLLGGNCLSFDREKCPPAQLHAFFLLQYPASVWMHKIFLLVKYVMIVFSCVAQ